MKISVVSSTYKGAANISRLTSEVAAGLEGFDYEIVIADDNLPDGTWEKAEGTAQSNPRLRVSRRLKNCGLSPAVVEGFGRAVSSCQSQRNSVHVPPTCCLWWDTGGYTYLHRPIPLFFFPSSKDADSVAQTFNSIVAPDSTAVPFKVTRRRVVGMACACTSEKVLVKLAVRNMKSTRF